MAQLFHQIWIGSVLVVLSVLVSAVIFLAMEAAMARFHRWLVRPPHRPKLALVLVSTVLGALGMITTSVWIWALAYLHLGVFGGIEEALYFSLESFTTLGFGDLLPPLQWRILSGMTAVNGFLNIGMISAIVLEAVRWVRRAQLAS
ncbi:Ion channel [Pseudooceanicola antarcticus]|uniref:Ion channel n=1 Tax=Pseudooceanicola antarcticus TaxID=1247613 RepID=A0A285IJG5_9RHOB|nr:ion channel [Pseudooceanicola antarcticus]PJE29012.1 two pore domain potassium channel family protein [Pseudooceanicola antarcticus]SNY47226.1 Ion channel [Pseudooceanicola antarcticus]